MKHNMQILILIIIILLVFLIILNGKSEGDENWINYKEVSSGNYQSSPEPLLYYTRTKHRLPYNYPTCIPVDYPVPHCRTIDELTN